MTSRDAERARRALVALAPLFGLALCLAAAACGGGAGDDTGADSAGHTDIDTATDATDATDPGGDGDATTPPVYATAFADLDVAYVTDYPVGDNVTREFVVRVWFPVGFEGAAPVIVVSHGGPGSLKGHENFEHLGQAFAAQGYLSLHVNHRPSIDTTFHRWDRPHDVSAVLDGLETGGLALPADFTGTADLERVGHLGHSWGAYTAHAVAGAEFTNPVPGQTTPWRFRDERIDAIVALSPQGWDGFGTFDAEHDITQPSSDNSWEVVAIPAYCLVGELEKDGVAGVETGDAEAYRTADWRLFPFVRYPGDARRYLSVLPGQTHSDLGGGATDEVDTYIAVNARLFFDVYLKGLTEREAEIGLRLLIDGVDNRRR